MTTQNTARTADGSTNSVTPKFMLMAERAFTQRDALAQALTEIEATPFSMVNDSDSLRHTIKTMQQIARAALKAGAAS
jgi:hypothetical protein